MRRHDKQINDREEIEAIIRQSSVCHLAMSRDNEPYLVPLSFGYRDNTLYFHSAREGKKISLLRGNPRVCFAFSLDGGLTRGPVACEWGVRYRSVIGTGRARFIDNSEEKVAALDVIMQQYAPGEHAYAASSVANTLVFAVDIDSLCGKGA